MKKIWVAFVLILICIGVCIFEQVYTKNFCTSIEAYASAEDIDGLKEYWKKENDTIYIFTTHEPIDELAQKIEALDQENEKETLKEIRAINKAYYENQKIGISNIL